MRFTPYQTVSHVGNAFRMAGNAFPGRFRVRTMRFLYHFTISGQKIKNNDFLKLISGFRKL